MREWFADEEAGDATRGTVEVITRNIEQQVVQWEQLRSSAEVVEG